VRLVCSVHERHERVSTSEGAERRAFGRTMRRRRSRRAGRRYDGHEARTTLTTRRPDCGRQRIQLIRRRGEGRSERDPHRLERLPRCLTLSCECTNSRSATRERPSERCTRRGGAS
jgi:hypothetical protein